MVYGIFGGILVRSSDGYTRSMASSVASPDGCRGGLDGGGTELP